MGVSLERQIYGSGWSFWLNQCAFPLKMLIPQPIIARVPGLLTNGDIRVGVVLQSARGRLLDVGCGPNRLVRTYRELGREGVGVDVHPWEGVDEVVEDTAELPFADSSFDTVSFVACLNHIPNREAVLREARRVLAPEGSLLVTNLTPFVSRVWHAWAFWDADQRERGMEEGEVWGFTRKELEGLLTGAGFRIAERNPFSWGLNELYVCSKESSP
jgi:SAM-dependent methyltransferase